MVRTCPVCGAPVPVNLGPGRLRIYCSPACRQAAYRLRHALPPELASTPSEQTGRPLVLGDTGLVVLHLAGVSEGRALAEDMRRVIALCEGTYMEWAVGGINIFGTGSHLRPTPVQLGECTGIVLCGNCEIELTGKRVGHAPNTLRNLDTVVAGLIWATRRRTAQRREEKQWA